MNGLDEPGRPGIIAQRLAQRGGTGQLIFVGFESVQELAAASIEDLQEIEGVGEKTAEKAVESATEWLEAAGLI